MTPIPLPIHDGPRPETQRIMPHMQLNVEAVPEVNAELYLRAYALPNVENRPTVISIPGARALWLSDDVTLAHPEVIVAGREFAHIHPDGSLHASLPVERAREAIETGWAETHPAAEQMGNPGMVMLYTPRTMRELDIVFILIVDSYNYVTGRSVDAAEIAQAAHA